MDAAKEGKQDSAIDFSKIDLSVKRRGEPRKFGQEQDPKLVGKGPRTVQDTKADRFIVFRPIAQGQGAGNIVHGLLAVHALAEEFGRIVCAPKYKDFNAAFEAIDPYVVQACGNLKQDKAALLREIRLVNYEKAPDECQLQERLASNQEIVYIVGNTYPRWRPIPERLFIKYYKPKPELMEMLPDPMPKTVVHLRKGDQGGDRREGIDAASLEALGKALPSDTYLVTNNLAWYDYFSKNFTWTHPNWHAVYHSAAHSFMWGDNGHATDKEKSIPVQNLQLWCDWYVIARAELVWHTHSDFSLSAIHWMNVESKTIKGIDHSTGKLKMIDEAWRTDEIMKPLKDRGPDDLKNCQGVPAVKNKDKGAFDTVKNWVVK